MFSHINFQVFRINNFNKFNISILKIVFSLECKNNLPFPPAPVPLFALPNPPEFNQFDLMEDPMDFQFFLDDFSILPKPNFNEKKIIMIDSSSSDEDIEGPLHFAYPDNHHQPLPPQPSSSDISKTYPWYSIFQRVISGQNQESIANIFNTASSLSEDKARDFLNLLETQKPLMPDKITDAIENFRPAKPLHCIEKNEHTFEIDGIKITCPCFDPDFLKLYCRLLEAQPNLPLFQLDQSIQGLYSNGQLSKTNLSRSISQNGFHNTYRNVIQTMYFQELCEYLANVFTRISTVEIRKVVSSTTGRLKNCF